MKFTELASLVQGNLASENSDVMDFTGVSIDSRTVNNGELFICIRGEINDGHEYIDQALERGAVGVMTDEKFEFKKRVASKTNLIVVKNTHEAMIRLAKSYRNKVGARIVGITGSNGKTTTKEFTYALLNAVEPKSYRSPGNFNNLFGAPLSLFAMPQDTKAAVFEMGISTEGEMAELAEIVEPDVAMITNIGPSHLESMTTVEEVAQAKLEMVTKSNKEIPLIMNADDRVLARTTGEIKNDKVTFGIKNKANYMPEMIRHTDTGSLVMIEGHDFNINLFGVHHVFNLLAAYAAVRTLGYSFSKVDTAKIALKPAPMRGQIIFRGGVTIIDDSYNANPESVKAGIEGLKDVTIGGRRVLILGDMLELGKGSERYHREIGQFLAKHEFALAIMIGTWSKFTLESAETWGVDEHKLYGFGNIHEASVELKNLIKPGDLIYIKGSRGVGLDKLIEKFEAEEVKS